jgi:hypothetical protein
MSVAEGWKGCRNFAALAADFALSRSPGLRFRIVFGANKVSKVPVDAKVWRML